jgi:hypothetical protein
LEVKQLPVAGTWLPVKPVCFGDRLSGSEDELDDEEFWSVKFAFEFTGHRVLATGN